MNNNHTTINREVGRQQQKFARFLDVDCGDISARIVICDLARARSRCSYQIGNAIQIPNLYIFR